MNLSHITTYHAGIVQARAYRILKGLMTDALKKHGLSMMQWAIVGLVYDAGKKGIRITELAKKLDTTLAFVTNHINVLESKDLVRRELDEADSRVRVVILNAKHRKSVKSIEKEVRSDLRKVVGDNISLRELAIYVKVLEKISNTHHN